MDKQRITINRRRLILSYTIQLVILNVCTFVQNFLNPFCRSSLEIFDRISIGEKKIAKEMINRMRLTVTYTIQFVIPSVYTKFKILLVVVLEKSLAEKSSYTDTHRHTHTHTHTTEKKKDNTVYRGLKKASI